MFLLSALVFGLQLGSSQIQMWLTDRGVALLCGEASFLSNDKGFVFRRPNLDQDTSADQTTTAR